MRYIGRESEVDSVEGYVPPFSINNQMLMLAAQIAEKTGKISSDHSFETKPHLQRNNRIRSIHSSLAIEANALSLDEVKSVINGKMVIGLKNDIQEVKNAWQAYTLLGSFNPYSVDDLKKLHGVMTYLTVQESGMFRTHNEGVFNGDRCIYMAPPPHLVPTQMQSLFDWMIQSREEVHPLILSSVFHYEFVSIHPFSDGNGRMARLWQTALLTEWNPVFQYLPLESRIHEFQGDYYEAIARCHTTGNSDAFIAFMLDKINLTLDWALEQVSEKDLCLSAEVQRLMDVMKEGISYSGVKLMEKLSLKSRDNFRKRYLLPALKQGFIAMSNPDKPTSRNQTYMKK